MCVCVHVPYKSNRECCVMRASLMYAFRRAYDLTYKMATFRAKRGLINRVYRQFVLRYALCGHGSQVVLTNLKEHVALDQTSWSIKSVSNRLL